MPDKPIEQELLELRQRNAKLENQLFQEPVSTANKWHSIALMLLFGLFVINLVLSVISFSNSGSVSGRVPELDKRITEIGDKASKNEGALGALQTSVNGVNARLDLLGFTAAQPETKK